MGEEFTAWFFNESQSAALGYPPASAMIPGFNDSVVMPFAGPYYPLEWSSTTMYPNAVPPQHTVNLTPVVDSSGTIHYPMSEEKRQELLDLMLAQFNEGRMMQ
jgi:hypothetical protein